MINKQNFAIGTNRAKGIDRITPAQTNQADERDPLQEIKHASDEKNIRSVFVDTAASPMKAAAEQTLLSHTVIQKNGAKNVNLALSIDKMNWDSFKRKSDLYAASQPPHTSRGREAFYQFLKDKNISCIVDLRSADSIQDWNHYYPETEQTSMTFGGLNVTAQSIASSSPGIQVTNLEINRDNGSSNANEQPHTVSVFHFLNWQDFSTINPESLSQLGKLLISHAESKTNALVHCKAGIGRTGTLVTYAQIKQMLETLATGKGEISREQIIQAVEEQININRKHRGCVETQEQFDLIVDTLARDYA